MREERFSSNSIFLASVHFRCNIDVTALGSCDTYLINVPVVKVRSRCHTTDYKFIKWYVCHTFCEGSRSKHKYGFILNIKITFKFKPFGVFRYTGFGTAQLPLLKGDRGVFYISGKWL
jgi:hypothetical protein